MKSQQQVGVAHPVSAESFELRHCDIREWPSWLSSSARTTCLDLIRRLCADASICGDVFASPGHEQNILKRKGKPPFSVEMLLGHSQNTTSNLVLCVVGEDARNHITRVVLRLEKDERIKMINFITGQPDEMYRYYPKPRVVKASEAVSQTQARVVQACVEIDNLTIGLFLDLVEEKRPRWCEADLLERCVKEFGDRAVFDTALSRRLVVAYGYVRVTDAGLALLRSLRTEQTSAPAPKKQESIAVVSSAVEAQQAYYKGLVQTARARYQSLATQALDTKKKRENALRAEQELRDDLQECEDEIHRAQAALNRAQRRRVSLVRQHEQALAEIELLPDYFGELLKAENVLRELEVKLREALGHH